MILGASTLGRSPLADPDYTTPSRRTYALPPSYRLPSDPRARLPAWADPQERARREVPYRSTPRRDAAWWRSEAEAWASAAAELGTVSSEGSDRMLGYAAACAQRAVVVERYEIACRVARHRVALVLAGSVTAPWDVEAIREAVRGARYHRVGLYLAGKVRFAKSVSFSARAG